MRVLSCNCRGLGNASTVHNGKKIAHEWKPDFSSLLETQLKGGDAKQTLSKLGFLDCFEIPRVGLSGGLALGWNPPWEATIVHSSHFFIHTHIKNHLGDLCSITFIYGHPVLAQRKLIWEELESLSNQIHPKWHCIRDFN